MILVSILLPLVMQSAAPARQANLFDLQVRATQAHKAYRERARSPQRCEAQTAAANGLAAKAAAEAAQKRRQLLTDLASRPAASAMPAVEPKIAAGEIGQAVALLSRDFEASAAMMAKVDPNYAAAATRGLLAGAGALPQTGALTGMAGEPGPDVKSVVGSILGDLSTEESLLNAYFSSSRLEIERACIEKPQPMADPFRVPARATKQTNGAKK